jgi:hypothetical protein
MVETVSVSLHSRNKNSTLVCQREKASLHDVFIFLSNYINKIRVLEKYEDNNGRKYT